MYALFAMDTMRSAAVVDVGGVDKIKKVGEMWKSLGQAEKDVSIIYIIKQLHHQVDVYLLAAWFLLACVKASRN